MIMIDLPMLRKIEVNEGSILNCHEIILEGGYWFNLIQSNYLIC